MHPDDWEAAALEGRYLLSAFPAVSAPSVTIDPFRRTITLLHTKGGSALRRYKSDGESDAHFGRVGLVRSRFNLSQVVATGDGKLVGVGTDQNSRLVVQRWLSNGKPDLRFGLFGTEITNHTVVPGSIRASASASDVLIAGNVAQPRQHRDCFVAFVYPQGDLESWRAFNLVSGQGANALPSPHSRILSVLLHPLFGIEFIGQSTFSNGASAIVVRPGNRPDVYKLPRSQALGAPLTVFAADPLKLSVDSPILFATAVGVFSIDRKHPAPTPITTLSDDHFAPSAMFMDQGRPVVVGALLGEKGLTLAYATPDGKIVDTTTPSVSASVVGAGYEGHLAFAGTSGKPLITYNTPVPVPNTSGTFFSVTDFDSGGEGVGYHDRDPVNTGGQGIISGVDIFDGEVIDTHPGEWLQYTVDIQGLCRAKISAHSSQPGGIFHLEVDGREQGGPLVVPTDRFKPVIVPVDFGDAPGRHILRLVMDKESPTGSVGKFESIQIVQLHLDRTFGTSGIVDLNDADTPNDATVLEQSTGRTLVGLWNGDNSVILSLHDDGSADPSFADDGQLKLPGATGMIIDAQDRLLVYGQGPFVQRYTRDGHLDAAFNSDAIAAAMAPHATITILTIDPSGHILLVSDLQLLRFNADGTPDTSFGNDGHAPINLIEPSDHSDRMEQKALLVAFPAGGGIDVAGNFAYIYSSDEYWAGVGRVEHLDDSGNVVGIRDIPGYLSQEDIEVSTIGVRSNGTFDLGVYDSYAYQYIQRNLIEVNDHPYYIFDPHSPAMTIRGFSHELSGFDLFTGEDHLDLISLGVTPDAKLLLVESGSAGIHVARLLTP
jgi:uncharacterized delta-60 repeat protein